jgi:putative methionine-R-sulfoxide reductase with GAF domain
VEAFLIETGAGERAMAKTRRHQTDSEHEAKPMTPAQRELLQEFQSFAGTAPTAQSVMEQMVNRLHEKMTRYNWVGFYLVDPADSGYLVVGPFAGSFTPNARIPLSTGLCGAAASTGQVVVVQDVTKDPRYLAGSSLVKSEMVVPIFVKKLFCRYLHENGAGICRSLRQRGRNQHGKGIAGRKLERRN